MTKNELDIENIIDNIGELIILNSGLNIFAESNKSLNKKDSDKLLKLNESIALKLNDIQSVLMKIEGVQKEIFEVLELNINNELYLIPMKDIKKVINPKKENIKGDFNDLIMESEKVHKILDLEIFFNHKLDTELEDSIILIIKNDLALKVTQTGKTKQVVVKSLEKNFTSTKYFSGIAINGLGKVELILDINKLEKEFINHGYKNN